MTAAREDVEARIARALDVLDRGIAQARLILRGEAVADPPLANADVERGERMIEGAQRITAAAGGM